MLEHSNRAVRILIVDDHPMIRDGITAHLASQPDLQVCGEADSEDQGVELVRQLCPDLTLVDVGLKSGNGIELVKRVRATNPTAKILVVSGFQESLYAERALRAGAMGYLFKQESHEKLIEAIRTVLAGSRFVSAALSQRLLSQALNQQESHADRNPVNQLTDRELEVFRLIGQGLTSGAIAEQLFLSPHTIDTHREKIKRKLGVKTSAELNRFAMQWTLEIN